MSIAARPALWSDRWLAPGSDARWHRCACGCVLGRDVAGVQIILDRAGLDPGLVKPLAAAACGGNISSRFRTETAPPLDLLESVIPLRVMFAATAITLFPEAFPGTLGLSLIGKALREGLWALEARDLRAFGIGAHRNVDDSPAGGGAGMVLRADVAAAAIDSVPRDGRPLLYPSPRGAPLQQAMVREWAAGPGLILFCGRFEGLDERVIEARGMREICVGDAVLAGGEAATLVILEACVRLLPGVLGNEVSSLEESFEEALLVQAQYTRPRIWEDRAIPEILLSGDHAKIAEWKRNQRERLTRARRPDLMKPK
jgi:tRNA (guanine37-N1)-methyltransferase